MRAISKGFKEGKKKVTAAVNAAASAASGGAPFVREPIWNNYRTCCRTTPRRALCDEEVTPISPVFNKGKDVIGNCSSLSSKDSRAGKLVLGGIRRDKSRDAERQADEMVDEGAHLLIHVECAEGLEHHTPFLAMRVSSTTGGEENPRSTTFLFP